MRNIGVEFEQIPPGYLLALDSERQIKAYSYSRERVLELSVAEGELAPYIILAKNFPGYPLYSAKISLDGTNKRAIINEEQKNNLLKHLGDLSEPLKIS